MPEQRRDRRLEEHLDCDVHIKGTLVPARITNVSRRGLFILFRNPPPVGHVVTLTVHLPGGTMDLMATVQRHAPATGFADEGAGLLLFALGGQARQRWEAFVRAGEEPGLTLQPTTPPTGVLHVDAAFLIQLESPAAMLSFFDRVIAPLQTVYATPSFRRMGAHVSVSLVHPHSEEQQTFTATVVEFSVDRPERMGLRFDPIDRERRQAFLASLGPVAAPNGRPLLEAPSGVERVTEYAFISPRLATRPPAPSSSSSPPRPSTTPSPSPPPSSVLAPPRAAEEDLAVVTGQLVEEPPPPPELAHVDRRALFDFNWHAGATDPPKKA
jgi:hypothetical protein